MRPSSRLIEASPGDRYWGEGADRTGQNRLGHLLVALRERLMGPTMRVINVDEDEDGRMSTRPAQDIPFLDLHPDWLARPMHETRFLQDWQEASTGTHGIVLAHHWFFEMRDYIDHKGRRQLGFIPQWSDLDGGRSLPQITAEHCESVFRLMDMLERFDAQCGYPFAWYFYCLHGNRVQGVVARTIAQAAQRRKIGLPPDDKKVLLRWAENEYGF